MCNVDLGRGGGRNSAGPMGKLNRGLACACLPPSPRPPRPCHTALRGHFPPTVWTAPGTRPCGWPPPAAAPWASSAGRQRPAAAGTATAASWRRRPLRPRSRARLTSPHRCPPLRPGRPRWLPTAKRCHVIGHVIASMREALWAVPTRAVTAQWDNSAQPPPAPAPPAAAALPSS